MTEDSAQDSGSEPIPDLAAAFDDEPASAASEPPEPSELTIAGEKPRKRVAKTLLFNAPTAEAIETYAAAAAAAAETNSQTTNSEKDLEIARRSSEAERQEEAQRQEEAERQEELLRQEKKQQVVQKQAARRVAKTLLFNEINLEALKDAAEAASAQSRVVEGNLEPAESPEPVREKKPAPRLSATGEKRLRRIAKTLQESDLGGFGNQSLHEPPGPQISLPDSQSVLLEMPDQMPDYGAKAAPQDSPADSPDIISAPAATEPKVRAKRQQFVAKTMLDHSLLWDTVSKFEAKMEVRAVEQMLEKANEPVKPFIAIECKKTATPCSFVWDDPETKQRFRYCDLCKTPVYNFTGLEQPEADELIFQRENRRNATLYKRADGKYMTVNCPVEVKRKRDMICMAVGGVALAVATIAFMILMPHPPKPEPASVQAGQQITNPSSNNPNSALTNTNYPGTAANPQTARTTAGQSGPAATSDGSFHMVNGQRVYPNGTAPNTAPVSFPAPTQTPAATTDADESGQFWQYDGPPPSK
ncbi:hypothetical protein BH11CYA1_BH11CYA1_24620 [soil metagenome]